MPYNTTNYTNLIRPLSTSTSLRSSAKPPARMHPPSDCMRNSTRNACSHTYKLKKAAGLQAFAVVLSNPELLAHGIFQAELPVPLHALPSSWYWWLFGCDAAVPMTKENWCGVDGSPSAG